tara:strand:- start:12704 stop:13621 length:918 start_codon:yes stop_codon:yes gene_type:complete
MKALITGIGGFVGSYLAEHLQSEGIVVSGFDRVKSNVKDATTYEADLLDIDSMVKILETEKPDLIFHLAGQSSVDISFKEPELTQKINIDGTENLFKAIIQVGITPKILVVSSAEVYGIPKSLPIQESHPLQPISPYGVSRVGQEKLCKKYADKLHIVVSRSFNHTGPKQPDKFVCPTITKQVAEINKGKREAEVMLGDPSVRRDFSDVRDIVIAYLLALQKGKKGETYNLCSGTSVSLREIIEMLGKVIGKTISVTKNPDWDRKVDIPELVGDHSKFIKDTQWQQKYKLSDTLGDMVEYWEKEI